MAIWPKATGAWTRPGVSSRRDFFDILTLAGASTVVNLLRSAAQRNRRGAMAGVARAATGLLEALWTEAAFLALPAMVIDDLNLKDALQRILKITRENLLLIGISTVGVRAVTGLIGFLLGVAGAVHRAARWDTASSGWAARRRWGWCWASPWARSSSSRS